ncbi:hypothetical protein B0H21DRAFT_894666 [Amylocystis lapponica]|nr:hypothetical protein B0H21DRAFT_894666 [Amylocystis lapponica]
MKYRKSDVTYRDTGYRRSTDRIFQIGYVRPYLSRVISLLIAPRNGSSSEFGPSLIFDQVFHVIFLSRFLLDLRGMYPTDASKTYGTSTGHMTSLRFASHIVGNMGASLETGQDLTAEQALDEDVEDVEDVPESPSMAGPQLTQGETDPPISA